MKSVGIVRKVDKLGRVVIPKEIRKVQHIQPKDELEIWVDGGRLVLVKHNPSGPLENGRAGPCPAIE